MVITCNCKFCNGNRARIAGPTAQQLGTRKGAAKVEATHGLVRMAHDPNMRAIAAARPDFPQAV